MKRIYAMLAGVGLLLGLTLRPPVAHAAVAWGTFITSVQERVEEVLQHIKAKQKEASQGERAARREPATKHDVPHPATQR